MIASWYLIIHSQEPKPPKAPFLPVDQSNFQFESMATLLFPPNQYHLKTIVDQEHIASIDESIHPSINQSIHPSIDLTPSFTSSFSCFTPCFLINPSISTFITHGKILPILFSISKRYPIWKRNVLCGGTNEVVIVIGGESGDAFFC